MKNKIEYIDCCFCSSKESKKFDSFGKWEIKLCRCGYKFTNPRPNFDYLKELYNEEYFEEEGRFETSQRYFKKNVAEVENWFESPKKILEIGCAEGDFLKVLNERGWEVEGIDISEDAIQKGRKKYDFKLNNDIFEKFVFNKKYDVIAMYQSLEHVQNPKLVLEKCHKLLNSGGILLIEVPNLNSFDLKISKKRRIWSYDLPFHLSHFEPKFLEKKLIDIGFETLCIDYYYPNFILFIARKLDLFKNLIKKRNKKTTIPKTSFNSKEMKRIKRGLKINILNQISKVFPGWRFTVISRKK